MQVYTYSEARQKLAAVLKQAEDTGKVLIRRKDGRTFALIPEKTPFHHLWTYHQLKQILRPKKLWILFEKEEKGRTSHLSLTPNISRFLHGWNFYFFSV